jgi:hypothetical protein
VVASLREEQSIELAGDSTVDGGRLGGLYNMGAFYLFYLSESFFSFFLGATVA